MTSPVDTSVKFFSSAMVGAPVLNGVAGAGVALLDACLVNGFGSVNLTSLVVSGGIATATFSGTMPALPESVVLIAGVTGAMTGLNGEQKVTAIGTNTIQFATALANGTAAGTITMKMAPLGWGIAFTGTNLRAYRPSDVTSNRFYLRVNDTNAVDMRVVGYESMTAISTGANLFPTNAQQSGGAYWPKCLAAGSGEIVSWMIFGNGKRFYYWVAAAESAGYSAGAYDAMCGMMFGDFPSFKSTADAYNTILFAQTNPTSMSFSLATVGQTPPVGVMTIARLHTNAVGAKAAEIYATSPNSQQDSGAIGGPMGPANGVPNALFLSSPLLAITSVTYGPRGWLPEVAHCAQGIPTAFNIFKGDIVPGVGQYAGRKLMAVPGAAGTAISSNGDYRRATFFDVTGPWQ